MIKVLFIHIMSEIGGSDLSLVRLVEGLDKTKYSAVVALPADGPNVQKLTAAGARVEIVPSMLKPTSRKGFWYRIRYVLNFPRGVIALYSLIRRERVAIVHTNTIHNLYGVIAARLAGVPHVWHFREIVWQSGLLRRLELWMARHLTARIVVTSDSIAEMYGPRERWPVHLIKVPNGIETDRFMPGDGARVRAELNVRPDQVLVGIVCRLDPWKGVETFLEAAALASIREPEAVFAVVGGPIIGQESYEVTLQRKARDLGISERVRFTSWRYKPDDMPALHRALDILVLASVEPEPFGLVVLEAMSTGKPVIATRHGGPLEIIEDGRSGDLVAPNDTVAMADAIVALIDDPARRARVGALARERVLAHYSAERYVAGIEAIYRELAG